MKALKVLGLVAIGAVSLVGFTMLAAAPAGWMVFGLSLYAANTVANG